MRKTTLITEVNDNLQGEGNSIREIKINNPYSLDPNDEEYLDENYSEEDDLDENGISKNTTKKRIDSK